MLEDLGFDFWPGHVKDVQLIRTASMIDALYFKDDRVELVGIDSLRLCRENYTCLYLTLYFSELACGKFG